jgi:37-kD nucleoid-associated bacterial protein
MSFFTDEERRTLKIRAMVFHVIGKQIFENQVGRKKVEHEDFFKARILTTDVSAVHKFKADSATKQLLEKMSQGQNAFEKDAKDLSKVFARLHGTSMREGAFFIFELLTDDPSTRIYSLIKYDYQEAIEHVEKEKRGSALRRIVQAFVASKNAVQKSALIRVIDGSAQADVAAHDRSTDGTDVTDYFASFLEVERNRSDKELNEAILEAVKDVLRDSKSELPNGDVASAYYRARDYLFDFEKIGEQTIVDAILVAAGNPEGDLRKSLQRRAEKKIKSKKLAGITVPRDNIVFKRTRMRRIKTIEGVTLTYSDAAEAIVVREKLDGGGERIVINTKKVQEDEIVSDNTR